MDKPIEIIIQEMRETSEATIRFAGEGNHIINLANLTTLIDSWRFSLEKINKMQYSKE